jgi:phenylpyruvate tautomerase PptA (4-oxalocrotonate tautomerase family)
MHLSSQPTLILLCASILVLAASRPSRIELHDLNNEGTVLLLPNGQGQSPSPGPNQNQNQNQRQQSSQERSLALAAGITDFTCRLIQEIATIVNSTRAARKNTEQKADVIALLSNGTLVAICTQVVQLVESCLPLLDAGKDVRKEGWLIAPTGKNMTLSSNAVALAGGNSTLVSICRTMAAGLKNMTATDAGELLVLSFPEFHCFQDHYRHR